ncbi:hypothetical protein ACHAXT_008865 [Thalassiosira profunda]
MSFCSAMASSRPRFAAAFTPSFRRDNSINGALCKSGGVSKTMALSSTTSPSRADTANTNDELQHRSNVVRDNSKLSLAPMMEYTDRHFRHLVRLISDKTLLYTEMVAANAIAHERGHALSSSVNGDGGNTLVEDARNSASLLDIDSFDPSYLLRFLGQGHNPEGASVLQLGGSDPEQVFLAARTVHEFNQLQQQQTQQQSSPQTPIFCDYSAINLNCGCPSPKVAGKGCFGAALMEDADLVRRLTTSMHEGAAGTMPITVKCRIGTDEGYAFTSKEYLARSEEEEYQKLKQFVETVASDGVVTDFQVHARIAVLGKNYSPSDNRKVPPLRYQHVQRLAQEFPELNISLNGGVDTLSGVKRELDECGELDGVMVGRGFVANPWAFAMADEVLYPDLLRSTRPKNRMELLEAYGRHADYEEEQWDPVKIRRFVTKAVSHIFAGEPKAKRYRIALDEIAGLPKKMDRERKQNPNAVQASQPPLSELILTAATTHLSEEVLYRTPEESYGKVLWDEEQAERRRAGASTVVLGGGMNGREAGIATNRLIEDWQTSRKADEANERECETGVSTI